MENTILEVNSIVSKRFRPSREITVFQETVQMFIYLIKGTMLKAGRLRVRVQIKLLNLFPVYQILSAALGPGVYSASNKNEYQKQENKIFLESRGRSARSSDNISSVYEPIVYTMLDPQYITTLCASTA
jgi:hypothetical protein